MALPERPEGADDQLWHGLYWRAWDALRFDRFYGAMGGEGPISYLAISAYARDNGITGNDFRLFHAMLTAIDAEWLDHVAEQDKAKRSRTP